MEIKQEDKDLGNYNLTLAQEAKTFNTAIEYCNNAIIVSNGEPAIVDKAYQIAQYILNKFYLQEEKMPINTRIAIITKLDLLLASLDQYLTGTRAPS